MTVETTKVPGDGLYYSFFPRKNGEQDPTSQSAPSLSEVGGKGLSLIRSSENGFPVPKGFVLSVRFFQPWIDLCMGTGGDEAWKNFAVKAEAMQESPSGSGDRTVSITKEDCDVLKAACYQKLAGGDIGCHFTPNQEKALREAIREVFGGNINTDTNDSAIVAVRSSSPEEDLVGTSFAGGYETTLGVSLDTSLNGSNCTFFAEALLTSFISMLDFRVVQYKLQQQRKLQSKRSGNGVLAMDVLKPKIAVVIQEQIDSETSGVAFSINPHNNCYDEILITANFGLGESVVSGIVTPDVYTVERCGGSNETSEDEFVVLDQKIGAKQEVIVLEKKKKSDVEGGSAVVGTVQKSNHDPSQEAALSEDQILELARLVANIEDVYSRDSSAFCPMDIEWAYQDGNLYLLQARPVTSYIPLFSEMITKRGAAKKLYMDMIVMTQGFSEPFSVLGMDVWDTVVGTLKPTLFRNNGPTGALWSLHGREYIQVSNLLKTNSGRSIVDKMIGSYDPMIGRAIESIDLDDYTPLEVPDGIRGLLWGFMKDFAKFVPGLISGLWYGKIAAAEYLEFAEGLITNQNNHMRDTSFRSLVINSAISFHKHLTSAAIIILPLWSKYRLGSIFKNYKVKNGKDKGAVEQPNIDDLLVALSMDLQGNPTSEMGHAMVELAGRPEILDTERADEFCKRVAERSFPEDFLKLYEDFMNRYGCRGMKEIDIAAPRTSEQLEDFFQRLKQIDPKNNAIHRVQERRKDAYEKLLAVAREIGREADFLYHEDIVHTLAGYREHPKYMLVILNGIFRKRALTIGEEFVREGRMESREQIFDLTLDQVALAQGEGDRTVPTDLRPWIEANTVESNRVKHVTSWPVLIDSRGKIIRGTSRRRDDDGVDDDNLLWGDPIAPGTIRGRAKVLQEPYEKPLVSGEILVARFTEPSWTPIFINAAAVVMEVGGPLQHGAVIAREYGIPCVSGLLDATTRLKDGDWIEVDGSAGTVRVLPEAPESQEAAKE